MQRTGRPRKTVRGRVPVSVLVEPDLYEQLRERARADHRTIAGELRRLIEQHVASPREASTERPGA